MGVLSVLRDVRVERAKQDQKWGEQNHPDGTGGNLHRYLADTARRDCEEAFAQGRGTWRDVLDEEIAEAYAEENPDALRAELIQVAAVAVAWVESIDRRLGE